MQVQIEASDRVVWVNDDTGHCIGRFSSVGIDVHASGRDQLSDEKHCLDCIGGLPFDESWERFKASMLTHHGVVIADRYKPTKDYFNRPC